MTSAYFASLPEEARAHLPARIVETLELIEPSRDSWWAGPDPPGCV
jgi:hypothetical protein